MDEEIDLYSLKCYNKKAFKSGSLKKTVDKINKEANGKSNYTKKFFK